MCQSNDALLKLKPVTKAYPVNPFFLPIAPFPDRCPHLSVLNDVQFENKEVLIDYPAAGGVPTKSSP
jgi:hypothetical protein